MKGVFLGACLQRHYNYDIDYNDIDSSTGCNLICDMLQVDLSSYDYLLASPPCNYYSRANYRRNVSPYALSTKHLLPGILEKFALTGKPFLVENVRNTVIFNQEHIFDICSKYNIFVYFVGRHTYFTNIFVNLNCSQTVDYVANKQYYSSSLNNYRQGGKNVHKVFEIFLNYIHSYMW